jgi:cysteine desulfurase
LNAPGILGFGKAVEIFTANLDTYRSKLIQLKLALTRGLLAIEGTAVNGPEPVDGAPHILNVSFDGVQGEALLRALGEQGLYVSTGSACGARQKKPSETLLAMGLPDKRIESAVRLSLSPLNSMDDINRAIETIAQQVKRMRMFKRR